MNHVVLLGDSIFDNAAYVAGGPDVIRQLREALPPGWRATLLAVDGAVAASVRAQLGRMPDDATHAVVSVGGNDALHAAGVLGQAARSVAEAVERLARVGDEFERAYAAMLEAVLAAGRPTALSTIYDPRYADPVQQRLAVTGLTLFNDVILRAAFARGLPLLDLRLICDRDEDYANPIEPSVRGGAKISAAMSRLLAEHDFGRRRTEVFV